jgi:hypothetical protein
MAKPFEILANCGSATLDVLMDVARSVGTALRAAIATTIVVDQRSDCGPGGIAFTVGWSTSAADTSSKARYLL